MGEGDLSHKVFGAGIGSAISRGFLKDHKLDLSGTRNSNQELRVLQRFTQRGFRRFRRFKESSREGLVHNKTTFERGGMWAGL